MNDLQKCQLDILKEFVRVCDKNNLQYYLVGGTCLGAIRHEGFIPWDDDIDVGMPRSDYDKFIKLQSEFSSKYFIQTYHSDKRFIYNYAKVRNSETTFVENYFACQQINHGVWIDVFPIDGISYKDKPAKKFKGKILHTWVDIYLMYPHSLFRKLSWRTLYKDIPLNLLALLTFPFNLCQYLNKLVDRRLKKIPFDKALLVANFCGTNPKKEAMPREIFMEGTKKKFEDIMVTVPKKYDKYLTLLFGEYMKLPPLDKQSGHHHHKGLDLNMGYLEYRKKHHL